MTKINEFDSIYNQPIKDEEFPEDTIGHAVYTGLGLVVLAVEVVVEVEVASVSLSS